MNLDNQLKVQAYLDGELSGADRAAVEQMLASEAGARDLLTELRQTKNALLGNELERKVSDTREFYWSQIRRRLEMESHVTRTSSNSWAERLRQVFAPLGAIAALLAILTFSARQFDHKTVVAELETSDDVTAYTFRSQSDPMSIVWLADRETSGLANGGLLNNVEVQ